MNSMRMNSIRLNFSLVPPTSVNVLDDTHHPISRKRFTHHFSENTVSIVVPTRRRGAKSQSSNDPTFPGGRE